MLSSLIRRIAESLFAGRAPGEPGPPMESSADRDTDERYALVYQEALRAIGKQESALDELRSRSGTLIAAAAIVTSFLGQDQLKDGVSSSAEVVAVVSFVAATILPLLMLIPTGDWRFQFGTKALLRDYVERDPPMPLPEIQRWLAVHTESNYDHNARKLDRLYLVFALAAFALIIEVVAWLAALSGRAG